MSIAIDQASLDLSPSSSDLRIGAVARRVPIRTRPSPNASLEGLLTAGATLSRSGSPVGKDGCPGGWFSVLPRGYVCLDDQVTTDLQHPTLQARGLLANPKSRLPYPYATARRALPFFEPDPQRRDGVRERGRLGKGSTFAIVGSWETLDNYDQRQRLAMLTLGVFVLTRDIEPVHDEDAHGFSIDSATQRLPIGLPVTPRTQYFHFDGPKPLAQGFLDSTSPIALTVKSRTFESERYLLMTNDAYVAERDVVVVRQRQEFPAFVTESIHWVDVDLSHGVIVMFAGKRPTYVARTRVRPNESVKRGTAWVSRKQITDLDSGSITSEQGRNTFDSPWFIELNSGLSLRAALEPATAESRSTPQKLELYVDVAARLFQFVEPEVPEGWHGVVVDPRHQDASPFLLR